MAQRKNKQAGKDQRARERARQRGQRRASRRNRPYLAWNHLTRDQKEVAKRIMAGDYRQIRHGGWGFLDKFLIFLKTIGFLQCLDVAGEGYTRRMITIAKLLLTYQVKILMGISSMNQVPELLFGDIGLLMMLGYTAEQIGAGRKTVGKEVWSRKEKRLVEISVTTHGFKLMLLRSLDSRIIVAAKVTQIQESEQNWTLPLIKQAIENIGADKIKLLLIDRGYLDGLTLWTLRHTYRIDWVIPSKTSMAVTKDARGLREVQDSKKIFRKDRKGLQVVGIAGLISYDQYGDEAHQLKDINAKSFT